VDDHKLNDGDTVTIKSAGSAQNLNPYNGTFVISVPKINDTEYSKTSFQFKVSTSIALTSTSSAVVADRFYQSVAVAGKVPIILQYSDVTSDYIVQPGRSSLNFQYRHNSGQTSRIDPSTTNIIDLYLVTQGYYTNYMNWITDTTGTLTEPSRPTLNELQQSYSELDSYKMISDSVVLNSVTFKPLFGSKATYALRGSLKVVKNAKSTASDSQIRSSVLGALNSYFAIDNWTFGDTFFFSELSAYLHTQLGSLISSVILVPTDPSQQFGDMYEIRCAPNEIFVNGATASDIVVITALTSSNMGR
jgi:hypothetical protein